MGKALKLLSRQLIQGTLKYRQQNATQKTPSPLPDPPHAWTMVTQTLQIYHKLSAALYFFFSTSCSAASLALFARMPKSRALARAMRRLAKALKFFSSSVMTLAFSFLYTCKNTGLEPRPQRSPGSKASRTRGPGGRSFNTAPAGPPPDGYTEATKRA